MTLLDQRLRDRFPSPPFIWWTIGLALTAGFGQGMVLFVHLAAGEPAWLWWIAVIRAHGHIQLVGWGGMFALGVGLITLLIRGMAVRLHPGLAGQRLYSIRLVWATVWPGNAAASLRVLPLSLPPSRLTMRLLGLAGQFGLAAVACSGRNLRPTRAEPPARQVAGG